MSKCDKIFDAKGKKKEWQSSVFGYCFKLVAKCPDCATECDEGRPKGVSGKIVEIVLGLAPFVLVVNNKMKKKIYSCSICGLKYKEKIWAKRCEKWCKKYKSCNLEIIKHSIDYGKNYSKN